MHGYIYRQCMARVGCAGHEYTHTCSFIAQYSHILVRDAWWVQVRMQCNSQGLSCLISEPRTRTRRARCMHARMVIGASSVLPGLSGSDNNCHTTASAEPDSGTINRPPK
jgi:hypothetical protein